MEYKDALEYLKIMRKFFTNDDDEGKVLKQAYDIAIEAVEKQIPKKPVYDETICKNGKKVRYHIICPGCYSFSPGIGDEHCVKCGQAIDWSEWDEDK